MNKYDADYQPRRCSATNRLIPASDYKSAQITLSEVDDSGVITGKSQAFNISGSLRASGKSDASLNRIFGEMGVISFKR